MSESKSSSLCLCESGLVQCKCCDPFLKGLKIPETPEELMRSRYTAYVCNKLTYIEKTMCGPALDAFDMASASIIATQIKWNGLTVLESNVNGNEGYVSFMARYIHAGQDKVLIEKSKFIKEKGVWFYESGVVSDQ